MIAEKVDLNFLSISARVRQIVFPEVDLVVGIATGGIVPASLVAFFLEKPLEIIYLNFRDETNTPRYEIPKLLKIPNQPIPGNRILIVDDVSVSGKTLAAASTLFEDRTVTTFVLKGRADYVAFPEIHTCVNWPWKAVLEE